MPVYEYACRSCGKQIEIHQKISEEPIKTCPECSQDTLERLISHASFVLKGGGWYSDGYGGVSKTESKSPVTSDKKKTESKTESSSSAKPEAAAAPASAPAPASTPKPSSGS